MNYTFREELNAFPVRTLSSSSSSHVVDWTVAWRGRQRVTMASGGDEEEVTRTLSPFPRRLADALRDRDVASVRIQVFNAPASSLDATSPSSSASTAASDDDDAGDSAVPIDAAAGLSVTATFVMPTTTVDDDDSVVTAASRHRVESWLVGRFRDLLRTASSRRWVLGSLESVGRRRLHRFVHVDWQNAVRRRHHRHAHSSSDNRPPPTTTTTVHVPVTLSLPHEAFSLSAEGVREFIARFTPCGGGGDEGGILGLHSSTEWSNLLVGHRDASSHQAATASSWKSWGRRGLWMEVRRDGADGNYQLDAGLLWKIRTRGSKTSWSDLLGDGTRQQQHLRACPLADSTALRVLETNPRVIVKDRCEEVGLDHPRNLRTPCIETLPNPKEGETAYDGGVYEVQANIRRTRGPGHGGRMETVVVNRHDACPVKVRIWQVIPPILKPVWSSFATNAPTSPRRRWKPDGTLELTLEANVTADSALRYAFDYDPVFSSVETFPGDPNRGFELPPVRAVVEPLCGIRDLPPRISLYSESLLFLSPLPDASMPFNVLSLSCTLVAFVVGSILNLLVRRASEKIKYRLHPESKPKSKMQGIKESLQSKLKTLRGKMLREKDESAVTNEEEEEEEKIKSE